MRRPLLTILIVASAAYFSLMAGISLAQLGG
jgi:hypothetical protein